MCTVYFTELDSICVDYLSSGSFESYICSFKLLLFEQWVFFNLLSWPWTYFYARSKSDLGFFVLRALLCVLFAMFVCWGTNLVLIRTISHKDCITNVSLHRKTSFRGNLKSLRSLHRLKIPPPRCYLDHQEGRMFSSSHHLSTDGTAHWLKAYLCMNALHWASVKLSTFKGFVGTLQAPC